MEADVTQASRGVRQQGLACPACGHRYLKAVYTRHQRDRVVRIRTCQNCTARVKTYEQVVGAVSSTVE